MIMKYSCNCLASQFLRASLLLRECLQFLDRFSHKRFGKAMVVNHIARDWGTMNDLYPDFYKVRGRHPRSAHLEYKTPADEAAKRSRRQVKAADLRSWIYTRKEIELMQKAVKKKFGRRATLEFHDKPLLHLHLRVKT